MSGASSGTKLRLTTAAEVGLSPNARLYMATGSPLLFRRASQTEQLHFDASWLYVPGTGALSPEEARRQTVSDVVLGPAIDLEDWLAYPIVAGGETVGQIVLPQGEKPDLNQNLLISLAGSLGPEIERDQRIRPPVKELFVQSLFQRESSPQQFIKRLLSLLSLEWPGSCAGAYIEYRGQYHLLLATGDVSRYYRLARRLTSDKGVEFAAACAKAEPFLPAELLPDQATFLTSAPDLYYVCQGLKSELSAQYIVVAGPGDLGRRTVQRLNEICALTSSLHESQFHTATELLEDYRSLSRLTLEAKELDTILMSAVGHLGRQMQISRVVLTLFEGNAAGAKTRVLLPRPTGESIIEEREDIDIPDAVVQKIHAGQSELIPDLTSCGLDEAQARRRYRDNVASEYCMPVETSRGVVGMVAFGSSVAGDYLARTVPTLSAVAGLISVWSAMKDLAVSQHKAGDSADIPGQDMVARLNTIRRLTEGYLHGLSESVSAVIGQAELLRDARLLDDPIIEAQRQTAAAETLCAVADRLDSHLAGLRQVCAVTAAPDDCIDGGAAISAIPAMMAGLIRQVKDSKNIDLQIVTEAESELVVRALDVYDYVVPLVMTIVEQSICSGQLMIGGRGSDHTVTFSVRFRQRLLAGLEPPRLLTELFPRCELLLQDSGVGQMIIGDSTLVFQADGTDEFVVTMDCVRRCRPQNPCGIGDAPGQGSN